MQRLLLLLVLVVWMGGDSAPPRPIALPSAQRLSLFAAGYALIVLIPALWSRVLARYVAVGNLHRSLGRFLIGTQVARMLIPAWFAVGVFALGWVDIVYRALDPIRNVPMDLPAAMLGTLPAMLAWMGLWWAAYPADRALREQSLLLQLQDGLPIHAPPGFWSYFSANLRMQLLFTVVPVALILLFRDLTAVSLSWGFGIDLRAAKLGSDSATEAAKVIEWVLIPLSAATVFVLAPEILRRVLQTQPLPDSALRRRLEEMCRRSGLRYRDILLWRTGNNMGNAAVMGVVPQVRYILLSDLLLETMTDQQIEAVFAHEAGHVVHRHLAWYGAFVIITIGVQLMIAKVADVFDIKLLFVPGWLRDPLILALAVGGLFLTFGFLSRWFERQADVYAARTMERELTAGAGVRVSDLPVVAAAVPTGAAAVAAVNAGPLMTLLAPSDVIESVPRASAAATAKSESPTTHVGQRGAAIFASALRRVAVVNNIPVAARNFSHGSIADRVNYLQHLSASPERTLRFDRLMGVLYTGLTVALSISVMWVGILMWRG